MNEVIHDELVFVSVLMKTSVKNKYAFVGDLLFCSFFPPPPTVDDPGVVPGFPLAGVCLPQP